MDDGTLIFPHRGKDPDFVPGYIKISPYVFKPIIQQCKFRVMKETECCGGIRKTDMFCARFKENVIWHTCQHCSLAE
jgi:hypothetical protein